MANYRFARRPKWILSHVLIALLVIVMINLGFWQLRRLHERQSYNASVRANEALPAATVSDVVRAGDPYSRGSDEAFRRVSVTGTYDTSDEIIIRARSLKGQPGVWVASPLRTADGAGVIVVRGFLPSQGTVDSVPADAEPPSGPVTVTGLLQATQTRGFLESSDPPTGHLTEMARVDVARMQQQIPYPLAPAWVQLQTQAPPQSGPYPSLLAEPVLTDGPHFGYAMQWFIFSTIAIIGYPWILRRVARKEAREREGGVDEASADREPAHVS